MLSLLTRISLLGAFGLAMGQAQPLNITNPNFGNIAISCSQGYAFQSVAGGTCADVSGPEQRFNSAVGMGWSLTPHSLTSSTSGLTNANTFLNPPSFTGMPFSTAAFLQGPSVVSQSLSGFVRGRVYTLSFYLGSRYLNAGGVDGDQTVQAIIDGEVLGTWPLVSYAPFSLRTAVFTVATSGIHVLEIGGILNGNHTAFFSGVSISANGDSEPEASSN